MENVTFKTLKNGSLHGVEDTRFCSKEFNRWRKARTARTIRRSVRCAIRQDLRACYTLVRC